MPSLREKPEDIPRWPSTFLAKYREVVGKPIPAGISKATMECLEAYDWPGNVRQLENVIERAVALEQTDEISPESLPPEVRAGRSAIGEPEVSIPTDGLDLEGHLETMRRRYMGEAMQRSGRRPDACRGAAGDDLPLVPLFRQEVQPDARRRRFGRGRADGADMAGLGAE